MTLILHTPICYVCFKSAESPVFSAFHQDKNEIVKICADICLSKYRIMEQNFRERKEEHKQQQLKQPKAKKVLSSLSIKIFKDDLKIEDIEDLDLKKD